MVKEQINAEPLDKEQLSKDIEIALNEYKQKDEELEMLITGIKLKN